MSDLYKVTRVLNSSRSSYASTCLFFIYTQYEFQRLRDDDHEAAKVGATQTTLQPTPYGHLTSPNIVFWDLPGIGTLDYPDLETYVQKVQLEKYHTFLIFAHTRFTNNDFLLAEKIRSMKKSFFFIRTKIDVDVTAGSLQRSFNEKAMLMAIRRECAENLGDLLSSEEDIFLISNHLVNKWDFVRLTQAILDTLSRNERESLTLSLHQAITRFSTEIFQRKVNVLKARMWKVAVVSAAATIFPSPELKVAVDAALILSELRLYRSQLGLPEEGSAEFAELHVANKDKVLQVGLTTTSQLIEFLAPYVAAATGKEVARYLPAVGLVIASGMSFGATYHALYNLLVTVQDAALSIFREAHEKAFAKLKNE
ncbi:PREDICTED: interferon-inducible GTPase 5-like isoform X2 [Acropora digitifera]|uniref:interferon-inducible GTPase 5-like isoform X2 n=1 Tax=Acropora digitifera TaxID=70779 RepID=UPI00077A35E6|nr:PREDICTED: interferon-inducible GTPase 5-like isoform X2 [Acropora digitifera]